MPLTLEQIEQEVDMLSSDEQQKLVSHLVEKFTDDGDRELAEIWADEAERRYQALKSGKTTARSAEDVFKDLEMRLAAKQC